MPKTIILKQLMSHTFGIYENHYGWKIGEFKWCEHIHQWVFLPGQELQWLEIEWLEAVVAKLKELNKKREPT